MKSVYKPDGNYDIAEIELVYKSKISSSLRSQITRSNDAYQLIKSKWDENRIELVEQFKVLYLNRANEVLGIYCLSTGGTAATVADPKLIFAAALKINACAIILCHNHPSGNLKPSSHDEILTTKIRQAGEMLDIKLLDHLIISREGYYSFADEGLLIL